MIINIKNKIQTNGRAKMLKEKDFINLNCNIKIIARLIPQAGQGMWKIFLKKQGIWKKMQIKNINTKIT